MSSENPCPGGEGTTWAGFEERLWLAPALSVPFLANETGAATDEVWFIGILAVGAIVGFLILAFRFVGVRQETGRLERRAASVRGPAHYRYCTSCGERLRTSEGICTRCGRPRSVERDPGGAL